MSTLDEILDEVEGKTTTRSNPVDEIAGPLDEGVWANFQSVLNGLGEAFTGSDRQTRATAALPSLAGVGVADFLGDTATAGQKATAAAGLLVERDPQRQIEILKANTSADIGVTQDPKGNIILTSGDRQVMLNKPGFSRMDVMQVGGDIAAFAPASRTTSFAGGLVAGAATQAGIEAGTALAGSEEGMGSSAADIAATGFTFGLFNSVMQSLGTFAKPLIDTLKNSSPGRAIRTRVQRSIENNPDVMKAAQELDLTPEELTEQFVKDAQTFAKQSSPTEAGAIALEREFDAPILTQGQRSLDQRQLRSEDMLRSGVGGATAENVMLNAEKSAQTRLREVAGEVQEGFGGPQIATRQEAGAALREGVRTQEQVYDSLVDEAYGAVESAALKPEGYRKLLSATRRSVRGIEFVTDAELAPATNALLKSLRKAERDLNTLGKQPGVTLKPIDIRNIEQIKRRLNGMEKAAANDTDRRSIITMKNAFEKSLDDSVTNALFTGDTNALAALRSARGVAREYFQKFTAQDVKTKTGRLVPDQAGRFIEKIVAANPTDEEVINSLFTASSFNKASAVGMARRYKEILGEGSEAWNTVRQAAFISMTKTNKVNGDDIISGQQSLKAFDRAMQDNATLMREIYTPDELGKIKRFYTLAKRTQPDLTKSRANPSGSGVTKILAETGQLLGIDIPSMGMAAPTYQAFMRALYRPRQAQNAVRPFQEINGDFKVLSGPAAVTTSTAGSQSLTQTEE